MPANSVRLQSEKESDELTFGDVEEGQIFLFPDCKIYRMKTDVKDDDGDHAAVDLEDGYASYYTAYETVEYIVPKGEAVVIKREE